MGRTLTLQNMNPLFKQVSAPIISELTRVAEEYEQDIKQGYRCAFTAVTRLDIEESHKYYPPITHARQMLALTLCKSLFRSTKIPIDIKIRARTFLQHTKGPSIGAYTNPIGMDVVRQHIAEFIANRDKAPCTKDDVFLCPGTSRGFAGFVQLLENLVSNKVPGIMMPFPRHPIVSALLAQHRIREIPYYLRESKGWAIEIDELERAFAETEKDCTPKVLFILNPHAPTGHVLLRENISEIIKFAYAKKLVLIANEVYQDSVYDTRNRFVSVKRVLIKMTEPYKQLELVSLNSCSKCCYGEAGLRTGYAELHNISPDVKNLFARVLEMDRCPNTPGQVIMDAMVKAPKKGDPSFEKYMQERNTIHESLKEKAYKVSEKFNSLKGFSCTPIQGGHYTFPKVVFPASVVEKLLAKRQEPDVHFAKELLNSTGVCVLPGSYFGQGPGSYHIAATILPSIDILDNALNSIGDFYNIYCAIPPNT